MHNWGEIFRGLRRHVRILWFFAAFEAIYLIGKLLA